MDESSLRAQLNNLEALRSSLHSAFRFWDWVVVVGVALEFVVLSVEYWDEWRAFWRATIRLPEKPKTGLFMLGFIGIAMVAGGIAKELKIDSQIEGVETQVREINEQLFGMVSKEAQDASKKSQLANDKSAAANVEAGSAQKKAEGAETSAAGIAQLEEELRDDETRLRTETEEAELSLAAGASGHTFRPLLFHALKGMCSSNLHVEYESNGDPLTRMFVQALKTSFDRLGCPPTSLDMVHGYLMQGTVVQNKWASTDKPPQVKPMMPTYEGDPSYMETDLKQEGIPATDAARLVFFALALGARLQKKQDFDENRIVVSVGRADAANGK